jgi:hypothetical protein
VVSVYIGALLIAVISIPRVFEKLMAWRTGR